MRTENRSHADSSNNPHALLIIELEMAVSQRDQEIKTLHDRNEYLLSHYQLLVSECAALYRIHGIEYAVASLDTDASHRLPESVMGDIRRALKVAS